jgi:hypothetical protein
MRRAIHVVRILLILAACVGPASAGSVSDCRHPFIYEKAHVNVLILRFETATMQHANTEEANQLAQLVELDTLFSNLGYRSIAVTALTEMGGGCPSADELWAELMGTDPGTGVIPPGRGAILLSGRLYQEGKELFLQTEMQFGRQGKQEIFGLPAGQGELRRRLEGALPGSRVSFPPRRLTAEDLERIGVDFRTVANLRAEPKTSAEPRPLTVDKMHPFAYQVTGVRDDWFEVRTFDGESGWIRAGKQHTSEFLHEKLPELEMLSGVVGYLRYRFLDDGRAPHPAAGQPPRRPGDEMDLTAGQARGSLAAFTEEVSGPGWDRARAFALTMDGVLAILSGPVPPRAQTLVEAGARFQEAAKALPYNGELHNLAAMSMAHLCDIERRPAECYEDVWGDFQQALAFAPTSKRVVINVQSYHELLQGQPGTDSDAWKMRADQIDEVRELVAPEAPKNLRRTDSN